ncbi:GDP-mannose 4,6-dehydratase [Sphingomonas taxi]|uniref:GDP-mannose 4,6-dehydratase n=1 Tax=Sphingomonas taxi TaxID=1549858 RepID=UPI0009E054F8|nr:GDP-mannose 4,6-dehydratase [Sphingomonas taxi]
MVPLSIIANLAADDPAFSRNVPLIELGYAECHVHSHHRWSQGHRISTRSPPDRGGASINCSFSAFNYAGTDRARVGRRHSSHFRVALHDVRPHITTHLAAESHVDRSMMAPGAFVRTNLVKTYMLLDAALAYWRRPGADARTRFHFSAISFIRSFRSA